MEFDLTKLTPDVRHLDEIRSLLYDKEYAKTAENFELYYMYRRLKIENGLRYDITVIPPRMLGSEFVKTKGHNHAGFYGEIYMVLEGEGLYLFQKNNGEDVEDVCIVKAKAGESVIIPAGYGHVTINPSDKKLVMANWVKEDDKASFSLFEKMQGACYYYLTSGWVKNENYKNVPDLRIEEPIKSIPGNLEFLKKG